MDIKNLNKNELLSLKTEIDTQLEYINKVERLKNKTTLSELKDNDEIYCINFNNSGYNQYDFVKIKIHPLSDDREDYVIYSTKHNSKPMGCSASFHKNYFKKHYFLGEFSSGTFFFLTLKPENWKEDLKLALDFQIELRRENFEKEVQKTINTVTDFINLDNVIF